MFGPKYYAKAAPGNDLRTMRVRARFTLRQVGKVLGISRQAVSDAELRPTYTTENYRRTAAAIAKLKAEAKKCGK